MQSHKERVVVEKQELDDKIAKLKKFCLGPDNATFCILPKVERSLLEDQLEIMSKYSQILASRIERFKGA